jgi:pimeloyl-ACP methyl ester carboxylesterase/DNA-binding CsgD family transcriptional regulator
MDPNPRKPDDKSAAQPPSDFQGERPAHLERRYNDAWLNRPDELLKKVRNSPQALEQELKTLDEGLEHRLFSVIYADALVIALLAPASRTVVGTYGADAHVEPSLIDWDLASAALRGGADGFICEPTVSGDKPMWIYVSACETATWDLSANLSATLAQSSGEFVLAIAPSLAHSPFKRACDAYNLTGLESRVVLATVQSGSIRVGAERSGVSYATAREAVSNALHKVGAQRLPGLVYRLSLLSLGIFPNSREAAHVLADRWGLTRRQAQIALLIAEGLTRDQTGRALGLSPAATKKQIDVIFQVLSASSAAEVARLVSAATTLQALSEISHGRLVWAHHGVEPLRLVSRPNGSRIAVSDFGPRSGKPVLLTHAAFSGRHPPRGLVRELVRVGYRPIAIDRPGYGLTEFEGATGLSSKSEPYAAAAHDMAMVLDDLGLPQADIIGRGGAQAALAFAQLYPDRCGRIVLISPIPPTRCDVGWRGTFAAYRELYMRNPSLIPPTVRLLSRLLTRKFVAGMVRRSVASSAPDLAITRIAGFDDDYYRTVQMYALGKLQGYIHEQTYLVKNPGNDYGRDNRNTLALFGEFDGLMEPTAARAYWQHHLPNATFETLTGQGRLLDYGLPHSVVARLRGKSAPESIP